MSGFGIGSSPTLTNCTISGNTTGYNGAGVYCTFYGEPTLTNCTITGNTAEYRGAGVYCGYGTSPTLTNCAITGNTAGYDGAGVYCSQDSSPTLANCAISGNTANAAGAGAYCTDNSHPTLTNCTISGNTANADGAGVYCTNSSSPTLTNCLLVGNTAFGDGGALVCNDSTAVLVNCSLSANVAYGHGAVYCVFNGSPTIHNRVLWGDQADVEIYLSSGNPVVTYTDIEGYWPGPGNINTDPLFVRSPDDGGDGWGDDPNTPGIDEGANDDFGDLRLQPGSPCVDAGDNTAVPSDVADLDGDGDLTERTPLDLDLRLRFVNDPSVVDTGVPDPPEYLHVVDMGAYEYGLAGDLDGDCDVDLGDLAQLLAYYGITSGATYEDGDLDGDGDVDLSDLAYLLSLYGTTC